jgi:amino acid adenylation domain-containing protein
MSQGQPSRADLLRALAELPADRRALLSKELADRLGQQPEVSRLPRGAGVTRLLASSAQERLFYLHSMDPDSPAYVMPLITRLRGQLDHAALRLSLTTLIDRHEILRTGFEPDPDTGLVQLIYPAGEIVADLTVDLEPMSDPAPQAEEKVRRPFPDLSRPPLLRAGLWRAGDPDSWLLAICLHHIVADGWSLSILVSELRAVYGALVSGQQPDLPELPLQYADYAFWQRERAASDEFAQDLAYWRQTLADAPAPRLGSGQPAGTGSGMFAGSSIRIRIPRELFEALRQFGRSERATPFMTLLAALATTISRWSGQPDIVIGTPVAGRGMPQLEQVVGCFINTLPLRLRVHDHDTFRDLLRAARESCLTGYAHQDVPFDRIVQAADTRRTGHQSPIGHIMLALNNAPSGQFELAGMKAEADDVPTAGAHAQLSVELTPDEDGGLSGWLVFASAIFDLPSAERFVSGFVAVLGHAVTNPDCQVGSLAVTSPAERRRLVTELSRSASSDADPLLVHERFALQAQAKPESVAVIQDDPATATAQLTTMTYHNLDAASARLAEYLHEHGVRPEHRVGVLLGRGDVVVALLAVLRAGATYLPLDAELPPARLAHILADARPSMIISRSGIAGRLLPAGHGAPVVLLDVVGAELERLPARPPVVTIRPDNASYVLYTSGTSGTAKGVVISHRALAHRIRELLTSPGFTGGDVVLAKTPVSFDPSLWEMLVPLGAGARMVMAAERMHGDPGYLADVISRHHVTSCDFVPAVLAAFVAQAEIHLKAASLRRILCGGDRLSAELATTCTRVLPGAELYNLYGPTETTIEVSVARIRSGQPDPVPIGRPVRDVQLYVLASGGEPQPIGVSGELYVGGVQLGRGYLGQPGLTASRFVPDPFQPGRRLYRTGDLARWRPDGALDFLGRVDDQVKIRGQRIDPDEIAGALRANPELRDAVVVPRLTGGAVTLDGYVVPVAGSTIDPADLRAYLRDRLPEAMIPNTWVVLAAIPKLPNGKVDRGALPAPDADHLRHRPHRTEPRDPLEEVLASIWCEVLEIDQVSVDDDFFELGGHSLLATMLLSQARTLFRFDLPIRMFVDSPTIADWAAVIREQARSHGVDADEVAALVMQVAAMTPEQVAGRLRA